MTCGFFESYRHEDYARKYERVLSLRTDVESEVETVNRIGRPWIVWTVCNRKCEPRRRFRRARGREVVEWKERILQSWWMRDARMLRRVFLRSRYAVGGT